MTENSIDGNHVIVGIEGSKTILQEEVRTYIGLKYDLLLLELVRDSDSLSDVCDHLVALTSFVWVNLSLPLNGKYMLLILCFNIKIISLHVIKIALTANLKTALITCLPCFKIKDKIP